MSDRDKKLLVYLGSLIILAAAYFLVGKPYLDKIDTLATEKTQLEGELREKREAYENKSKYEQGITDAYNNIQSILDEFPEDNSDEKSIMFVSHAETDVPIWFSQVKFAEETKNMISGSEENEGAEESSSDAENSEQVGASDEEGSSATQEELNGEVSETEGADESVNIGDLMYRDTEIGLTFETTYDGFKNLLAYVRDYKDRLVIKDIDISYNKASGLVSGNLILSQYAILGPGRVLPDVETGVDDLGVDNIFMNSNNGGSVIDLLVDVASDLLRRIIGVGAGRFEDEMDPDFFIKVNAVTDNTSGKTVGKTDDLQQSSYVISDENGNEDVRFKVSGSGGHYTVSYSIGGSSREESIDKDTDSPLYLRVISTERMSDSDNVSVSLHVINNSDLEVMVSVEGEDENRPRVDIVEKVGDVTVK